MSCPWGKSTPLMLSKLAAAVAVAGLTMAAIAASSPTNKPVPATTSGQEARIPAYHMHPPTGPLPATLSPDLFPLGSIQRKAYAMAAKIKAVLYQEPCYCYCDRDDHHHCLLDCYGTRHAAGCGICMGEAIYAYEQTQKGRTPAEIRQGIIRGEWREVLSSR